jgi:hypothetical protein
LLSRITADMSWYEKQVTDRPSLTREERHWRAVRRPTYALFGCGVAVGLAFLGDYLGWFALELLARFTFIASWGYGAWAFMDAFKAWFLRD